MGKREPNRRRKGWRYTTAFRPRANVDGRRWEAQAFQHWLKHYQDRLGGEPSEDQVGKCRDLSLIAVSCERQQEALARGQDVDTVAYGQALGHRARLERELFGGEPEPEEQLPDVGRFPEPDLGLPDMDFGLLTELELLWFCDALERAIERAERGEAPWWSRGAEAIWIALRRVSMGLGRPCDFETAQCIHNYRWVQHRETLKPYDVEYFAGYHEESEAVPFDDVSYPPDAVEPEEGETVGFVEDPLPGIPPPAGHLAGTSTRW